jgi:hypothetical protein
MRKLNRKQKATVVIAAGALGVAGSGIAYAYWTTTGSGTGSAAAAAPQAPASLTFTQNTLTAMFPGDTSQNITTAVTNTGPQNAYVAEVKAYLTVVKASGTSGDKYVGSCTAADFLLASASGVLAAAPGTPATAIPLTWTAVDLAKTNGTANATGKIQFNNTGGNQDGCKEAAVTIHYLAS